jgi:hypothetical protein
MAAEQTHTELAEALRRRVRETGTAPEALRTGALAIASAGSGQLSDPHDALVRTIADTSYRVTDEMVANARASLGSDVEAFEVIVSASVGAGLRRWDAAIRAIEEATDAAS